MTLNTYLSIITLNVNGSNVPTKRHRVAEWMKKTRPIYMLPPRDPSQIQRYTQTKSKGMEKDIHSNGKEKIAGVVVRISNKIHWDGNFLLL